MGGFLLPLLIVRSFKHPPRPVKRKKRKHKAERESIKSRSKSEKESLLYQGNCIFHFFTCQMGFPDSYNYATGLLMPNLQCS